MRVLVTGAAGFVGRYAAAELARRGAEVVGTYHRAPPPAPTRPEAETAQGATGPGSRAAKADGAAAPRWVPADLRLPADAERAVAEAAPDAVLHLAGQPRVGASFDDPARTLRLNAQATLNLLEAVRRAAPAARCIIVSSCEVYGGATSDRPPLRETEPLRPLSPYAVAKACAEFLAHAYHRTHHLRVTILRPFPHTGPGQAPDFVCPDFSRQIAWAETGRNPPVVTAGNDRIVRDYLDVRDVAAAYADALAADLPGGEVYNVASGRGVSIGEILHALVRLARVPIDVRHDPSRVRAVDIPTLVGDAARFRQRTGWAPRFEWPRTLADVLEDARARVLTDKPAAAG